MSQSLKEKLASILTWMQETDQTVSSQDSFNPDALQPEEVTVIVDMFMEVLAVELTKKQLAMMIKSTKLLLMVTGNLVSARERLASLLESLLVNIITVVVNKDETPELIKKGFINEFLVLFESCMSDSQFEHLLDIFRNVDKLWS